MFFTPYIHKAKTGSGIQNDVYKHSVAVWVNWFVCQVQQNVLAAMYLCMSGSEKCLIWGPVIPF